MEKLKVYHFVIPEKQLQMAVRQTGRQIVGECGELQEKSQNNNRVKSKLTWVNNGEQKAEYMESNAN